MAINLFERQATLPTQSEQTNQSFWQEDVAKFKMLIWKWVDAERAKRLIVEAKQPKQWFIGWALEKTKETAIWWLKRIQEAGVWLAEWKYDYGQAFVRWWAGALQTAFSPLSWVLWETFETWVEKIPQDVRQNIIQTATPTIQWVTEWYNKQSPEQQQRLRDIWVWVELLSTFVWWKWVQEWFKKSLPTIEHWIESISSWVKSQAEKIWTIWKTLEQKWESFRNTLSWLDEREISALKNTPKEEFEWILNQAKSAIWDDYAQTPYHEWAKKANEAFKQLEDNIEINQQNRIQTIQNSWINAIDTKEIRREIVEDIKKTFNVEWVDIIDWVPVYKSTEWRRALLDASNKKDLEALVLLEEASKSSTPLEMMDTIKKMQNLIYDSNILNRTSKDMYNLVKRSIGKLNKTFKEQVWWNYAKILDEMSEDIRLKSELNRVFKAWLDEVGNRWELAMKRLAKWTTTSSEARNLAIKVLERTWIDLIKEARLRQLVMDLVWDKRWADLFWVIKEWPSWIISKWIQKAIELTPLSKEKTAISRTKKIIPKKKENGNNTNNNNTYSNTWNKKDNWKNNNKIIIRDSKSNDNNRKIITKTTKLLPKKAIDNKAWFINPSAIADDLKKITKKMTTNQIDDVVRGIVTKMWVAKDKIVQVSKIVREWVKKEWQNLKNKLWDMLDDIADKTWTRLKIMWDDGIGVEKTGLLKKSDDLNWDNIDQKVLEKMWTKKDKYSLDNVEQARYDMIKSSFRDKLIAQDKLKKWWVLRQWEPPISKNWDSTWKVARERFDIQNLEKLWQWSDRVVYDLWDGKVLKVSKTARWLQQQAQWTDFLLQDAWITPKIYEQWDNYIVTEKLRQFKDLSKEEKVMLNNFIDDMKKAEPWFLWGRRRVDYDKVQTTLEKWGWDDLINYDMETFGWGDIRKANLSIKNWRPILIDEWTINLTDTIKSYTWVKNLDDMDFRDVYTRSKEIKKRLWDIDTNTMYNIWGVMIWGWYLYETLYWKKNNQEI